FSSRRLHTSCYRDWSSDVCSSDLTNATVGIIIFSFIPTVAFVLGIFVRRHPAEMLEGDLDALVENKRIIDVPSVSAGVAADDSRSEERRVGKGCRSRWSAARSGKY